ncbi:hypothetical protein KKH81_00930 [Patescibacteria group bacterium]|nr:hypothetical protein [Patescibacteria group bacterium]
MKKTLKAENRIPLATVLLANLGFFFLVLKTNSVIIADVATAAKDWQSLLPAGAALVVCGVLNELVSPGMKARLVFWRWRSPLPGGEAFTRLGPADSRVDMTRIHKKLGSLPLTREEQNLAWYKLYKKVAGAAPVIDSNKAFLFCRDYACIAAMMLVFMGGWALVIVRPFGVAWIYVAILLAQYLIVRLAAANAGRRLVTNVLAVT